MAFSKEEIAELKADIAAARKRDMNFAFCLGKTPETAVLMCDKLKKPPALHKLAKKSGETNKIASGVMNVDGRVASLTCLTDPPSSMARKVRQFLKAAGLNMNVVILSAEGELLDSEAEDEDENSTIEPSNAGQANEAIGTEVDPRLAALKKALATTAEEVTAVIDPTVRAKLATALKKTAADVSAGNLDAASSALQAIKAAMQRVSTKEQTDAPEDGSGGTWEKKAATLEPLILAALKANHPEATKIRAVWGFAQEKAQMSEFDAALQAADRLDAILQAAPAQTPDAPPQNVVAFQRSRILWIEAKQAMRDGLSTFRSAVLQQSADDEDHGEVTQAVDSLVAEFEAFDTKLENILDDITQTPEGPERTQLKSQASRVIGTYLTVLDRPFFKIVDNNPFVSVNVAARGRSSLALVQSTLA